MALTIKQLNNVWKSDVFGKNKLQRKIGRAKLAAGEVQEEITSGLINSIEEIRKEQGSKEALRVAALFQKAISLYSEGVTMASAVVAATELNNDKKNFIKIAGFSLLCLASLLPHILVEKEQFDDYVDELTEDAKRESGRKTAKVTRLKTQLSKSKPKKRKSA